MALHFTAASSHQINYGDVSYLDGITKMSVHAFVRLDNVTADHALLAKYGDGFLFWNDDVAGISGNTDTYAFAIQYDAANVLRVEGSTNAAVAGQWQSVLGTFEVGAGANGLRLYIGGTEDANSPGQSVAPASSLYAVNGSLRIGANDSGLYMDGALANCAIWNAVLNAADAKELAAGVSPLAIRPDALLFAAHLVRSGQELFTGASPSTSATAFAHPRIYRPAPRQIITAPAAAGGETTVTPGVGTLTITGLAPTILHDRVAQPGAAALTLTGLAPTILHDRVVQPGAAGLTLTGLAPTPLHDELEQPGAASLSITGFAPSVLTDIRILPDQGALALTGFAPSVLHDHVAQPGVASLGLTGLAPAKVHDVIVSPGVAALALTGLAPTPSASGAQAATTKPLIAVAGRWAPTIEVEGRWAPIIQIDA